MKYEIEIEGLPEGWRAKEFRLGEIDEPYYDPATKSICRLLLGSTVGVLIVEKIQPSRTELNLSVDECEELVIYLFKTDFNSALYTKLTRFIKENRS
jgi:hypothetical protein